MAVEAVDDLQRRLGILDAQKCRPTLSGPTAGSAPRALPTHNPLCRHNIQRVVDYTISGRCS
jgi:hypothetical protein